MTSATTPRTARWWVAGRRRVMERVKPAAAAAASSDIDSDSEAGRPGNGCSSDAKSTAMTTQN